MARIIVEGNGPLRGQVRVSGSKNAVLPILAATLLADEPCRIGNVPALADVQTSLELLGFLGALAERPASDVVEVDARTVHHQTAPYELVRQMRASIVVLGPLLARFGRAEVSMPGGCQIGGRPVDQHLKGLAALGAEIAIEGGYIHAKARRLRGARVVFDLPTVTGTENLIMAAVLASGETVLENCACEPEIVDLVGFLRVLGAQIDGAGTPTISIQGRDALGGGYYAVQADRIEAGTFMVAGAITGGDVEVLGARAEALGAVIDKLRQAGAEVVSGPDSVRVIQDSRPRAVDIDTAPFPGFPTDMQAQFCALNAVADGRATIRETVFENRFMHVPELRRFGAQIEARGDTVTIDGVAGLSGAPVMATDLRASACLVLAGLIAEGQSVIDRIYHLDRGYERIEQKLSALGAKIWRA